MKLKKAAIFQKQGVSAKFIDPCPLPEGEIGVYTISAAAEVITDCIGATNLTHPQLLFVLKKEESINVANYLYDYCTPESAAFAKLAIDAYPNAEVYYVDRIITNLTGIQNCVFESL